MARTRQDLRDEALANLRIVQQADTSATRTRAEWVTETLGNLGLNQAAYTGNTRTRAQLASDAMAALGVVQKTPTVGAGTRTLTDLISQVLFNLGALGEGNTVPSADATVAVTAAATSVARMLDARQVVSIASTNAIDNAYFLPFASIVTEAMKEQYGIDADTTEAAGLISDAKQAELDLKIMTRATLVDGKIDAIAADLRARAIASLTIPVVSVPEPYYPALVAIVANEAKGYFDWLGGDVAQRAAGEAATGELKLRQITGAGLVDEKLPSLIGELNARGVCTVTNIEAIPGAWFSALADIAAESCRAKFVVPTDIAQRVTQRAMVAERTLKNLTRTYLVERNIDSIISELAAREIVYLVDDSAIPEEWFPHLAWIVADRCKAKFELDADVIQLAASEGMNAIATLREQTRGRPSYLTLRTSYM